MLKAEVTEQEIEVALHLSAQRDFAASLALLQGMLTRADDVYVRMKILFGIVTCSTWLKLDAIRENAIRELTQLPDFDVSHAFIITVQAAVYVNLERALEALDLIDRNLMSAVLQRDDMREMKYENLYLKGNSFVQLARYDEALCAFDAAHDIYPDGNHGTEMLIERSNCFVAFGRFGEAYDTASQVLARGDEEFATLAMQYMAECRMWQFRETEALELYVAVEKRLPCRLVDGERIRTGIRNAMARLEKLNPSEGRLELMTSGAQVSTANGSRQFRPAHFC